MSDPSTELTASHHPMLASARRARDSGGVGGFAGGLRLAVSSVGFLLRRRSLWPQVAVPALINVVLFVLTAGLMIANIGELFALIWAQPAAGGLGGSLALALWWIVRVLLVPLTIVFAYFVTLLVGGVIASPFNDALSEKVEGELLGRPVETQGGVGALVAGGLRGIFTSLGVLTLYLICVAVILPLNLLPGVGSVAATVLGALVGAFFLAVEYTDYVLERRGYGLRRKFATIWTNRAFAGGFGLGTSLLLWIPLLNVLCMPIAVVGGTAVALALDEGSRDDEA